MLLIYGAENCWTEQERRECMLESLGICDELAAEGKYVASAPLHSVSTATSLRIRNGKRQITDGPFAETTEQLGGYYVIDVDNLDEAIEVASRLPPAKKGTVEIRPLFPLPDRPETPFRSVTESTNADETKNHTVSFVQQPSGRSG
ncbi:MAG: YciI family protein [Pirellulaceae bacterium]